jgi:hypothetical protein
VNVGRGEPEQQRQARAATQQGMEPVAAQQRARMVGVAWPKAASGSARRQGRIDALSMMRSRPRVRPIHRPARTSSTNNISLSGAPAARSRLDCCALLGTRGRPSPPCGSPQARASAGQAHSQSCASWYENATACVATPAARATPRYRCGAHRPDQRAAAADTAAGQAGWRADTGRADGDASRASAHPDGAPSPWCDDRMAGELAPELDT